MIENLALDVLEEKCPLISELLAAISLFCFFCKKAVNANNQYEIIIFFVLAVVGIYIGNAISPHAINVVLETIFQKIFVNRLTISTFKSFLNIWS